MDSTIEDINVLEIYNLKEKLKVRDPKSSLPELEDMSFLRDLGLIKEDEGVDRLTIAGLLFVGKETAINRLLPQAEVIYLHYSSMKPDKDKTQKLCLRQQTQICGVTIISGGNRKWQNHYLNS